MEDHFSHSLCLPLKSKLSRIGLNQRKSRTFNLSWVSLTSTAASFPTIPTSWFLLLASLARVLLEISQLKLVNHSKPLSPLSYPPLSLPTGSPTNPSLSRLTPPIMLLAPSSPFKPTLVKFILWLSIPTLLQALN